MCVNCLFVELICVIVVHITGGSNILTHLSFIIINRAVVRGYSIMVSGLALNKYRCE